MSQAPQPERARLLDLAARYLLENGISGVSLRRLSEAIGSNNRMLLYYFGSKEKLYLQALRAAAQWFPELARAISRLDEHARPLERRLIDAWQGIAAEANLPFHRMFFEAFGLATRRPGRYDEFLQSVGTEWRDRVAGALRGDGLPGESAEDLAREIVALWRGLQVDLLTTGDRGAIDRIVALTAASFAARAEALAGVTPAASARARDGVSPR